ncbi:gamma-glutamylcyclotransferase [Paenibacillus cisolokensis]|uniref:gamma-glutamylcyclotransferase family protein n=1 Tax=Paenibacillus cisolokensis TaxID=1658519 RepID=UPI003D2AC270
MCNEKTHLLFVYGTLRLGESNHGLLEGSRCAVPEACIEGTLVDTGYGYPAVRQGTGRVYGEIYEIDEETLRRIDALEDYYGPGDPRNLYERVQTTAGTDRGDIPVLAYVSDRFAGASPIPSGDWKQYRKAKTS